MPIPKARRPPSLAATDKRKAGEKLLNSKNSYAEAKSTWIGMVKYIYFFAHNPTPVNFSEKKCQLV